MKTEMPFHQREEHYAVLANESDFEKHFRQENWFGVGEEDKVAVFGIRQCIPVRTLTREQIDGVRRRCGSFIELADETFWRVENEQAMEVRQAELIGIAINARIDCTKARAWMASKGYTYIGFHIATQKHGSSPRASTVT